MPFQVGDQCVDTPLEAAASFCAHFPVTNSGMNWPTVLSCTSFSATSFTISNQTWVAGYDPMTGVPDGTWTFGNTDLIYPYTPLFVSQCSPQSHTQQEYVDASLIIFVALLGVWASLYGYRKIMQLLAYNSREVE